MNIGNAIGVPFSSAKSKLIVYDSFNRPDNSNSLGKTDTGQTWEVLSATWGIVNNQAYCPSPSASNDSFAVISTEADCAVEVTLALYGISMRVGFRVSDKNNGFILNCEVGKAHLYRRNNGAFTSIGSYGLQWKSGDKVKIVLKGASIKVHVNDIEVLSVTDSFNINVKKHGLGNYDSSACRWDDFKVVGV